jgi:hypothetical protein
MVSFDMRTLAIIGSVALLLFASCGLLISVSRRRDPP